MFADIYRGRRVLVTGGTGFKGSWLCQWLLGLGARVTSLGLEPATDPNLFTVLRLSSRLEQVTVDVRDELAVAACLRRTRPEIVFHLAAQPIVRLSYEDPKTTFDTNIGGVVNLLEAVRATDSVRACVVVTSDKCYENREWHWGYRECDPLGGYDPYSASKGAAELVVSSYRRSFFQESDAARLASARAGNVIGGGDWSADRIVPDFVRTIVAGKPLCLRSPQAVRPWQHVLEPLSGYLTLGAELFREDGQRFAEAWNFGPADDASVSVQRLAAMLVAGWGQGRLEHVEASRAAHEATLLKLDCSKAAARLGWRGVWALSDTVRYTVEWYRACRDTRDLCRLTDQQIGLYQADAAAIGLPWAGGRGTDRAAA